jgi:hypothetical protein
MLFNLGLLLSNGRFIFNELIGIGKKAISVRERDGDYAFFRNAYLLLHIN